VITRVVATKNAVVHIVFAKSSNELIGSWCKRACASLM